MISVERAVALVLKQIRALPAEEVPLLAARGRVLARDVRAGRSVPPFDNSAMDGFAVRWRDVANTPATLRVIETIAAGYVAKQRFEDRSAMRIMTGAPVPRGAEAIVRVEDTECSGDRVLIKKTDGRGSHIRKAGEDIRKGQVILAKSKPLAPADLGLLASVGRARVAVFRRPTVAIISTGDELLNVDDPPAPGKIVNSNSYTLAAAIEETGALPRLLGIARDTRKGLAAALRKALRCDVIMTSGGVSVGDYDFVKEVLRDAGMRMDFWRVAQRPGHPMAFGWIGRKPVFGLPGNPVSSVMSFLLYARPALLRMMGHKKLFLPVEQATLEHDLEKKHRLKEFIRCRLRRQNGALLVASTGTQSSGVLRSLSLAQGLIVVREQETFIKKGTKVPVILLGDGNRLQAELGF
ncbi:MAG: molybdopterin molybdotransferase MoeA [Deltaproteobacteria bacterium]|nr:molybdopterin molybdotransferase MoeA [Deltaproteobacteria bacterium]MBM4298318.1 molybdopterin molybdotransferase MoeA [Deltaproteobacteria bacterium]